jgi:hypothetical protein
MGDKTKNFRVVFLVHSAGGGVDGRDPSDKPRLVWATYDQEAAQKCCEKWNVKEPKVEAVDVNEAKRKALAKLSELDRLVLGLG